MKQYKILFLFPSVLSALVVSCSDNSNQEPPQPASLQREYIGYYTQMIVEDHIGPKAQIWLADKEEPIWFVSVRDAIRFTRTPEEADNIIIVYAHDMGQNPDYSNVSDASWIDINNAVFVIDSKKSGGMGMPETIPFANKEQAQTFIDENDGTIIMSEQDISDDYLSKVPDVIDMDAINHMNEQHNHESH